MEKLESKIEALVQSTEQTLEVFQFAGLVDCFKVARDGAGVSDGGGFGRVVIDRPALLVWWWVLRPGDHISRHWHRCPEQLLVIKGDLRVTPDDGPPIVLHEGEGCDLVPYEPHTASTAGGSEYFVVFAGSARPRTERAK